MLRPGWWPAILLQASRLYCKHGRVRMG